MRPLSRQALGILRSANAKPVPLAHVQRAVGWGNTLRTLERRGFVTVSLGHVFITPEGTAHLTAPTGSPRKP